MADTKLKVMKRDSVGTNSNKKLRRQNLIPAVVYGKGEENLNIQVEEKELNRAYLDCGTSVILDLEYEGTTIPALFKEIVKHPYKNNYTHADFFRINMKEALRISIPIMLEGRDEIRVQPSILNQIISEIEIECLPSDIPEFAIVDVRDMQIGDSIMVKDLDIANNDKLQIHEDLEEIVCTLQEPREETVEEETEESAAEVPTVDETEKGEEGEE